MTLVLQFLLLLAIGATVALATYAAIRILFAVFDRTRRQPPTSTSTPTHPSYFGMSIAEAILVEDVPSLKGGQVIHGEAIRRSQAEIELLKQQIAALADFVDFRQAADAARHPGSTSNASPWSDQHADETWRGL